MSKRVMNADTVSPTEHQDLALEAIKKKRADISKRYWTVFVDAGEVGIENREGLVADRIGALNESDSPDIFDLLSDALLMAAAPQLLTALKELHDAVATNLPTTTAMRHARVAISRSEAHESINYL